MIRAIIQVIGIAIIALYLLILLLSLRRRDGDGVIKGTVNVIVPTYNEVETVGDCLESLLKMNGPPEARIFVVDDNSTDGTRDVVSRFEGKVTLLERPARRSKADALNHAVRNIEGDIFAVVDADCTVGAGWLSQVVKPLKRASTGVSTGSVLVGNRNASILTRMQSCEMAFLCHQLLLPAERLGALYSINGNNFAFTRECWRRVGGFDPSKLTEDTDFAVRTRLSGLKIRSARSRVFTHVPESLSELLRQRRRWYIGWYQDFSNVSLLGGALFILLFYFAPILFLAAGPILCPVFMLAYLAELTITYRGAYGRVDMNPVIFLVLVPLITAATIVTALPSVLKGRKAMTLEKHW